VLTSSITANASKHVRRAGALRRMKGLNDRRHSELK
jgi:hypothetical protein